MTKIFVFCLQRRDAGQFAIHMHKAMSGLIAVILLCVVGAMLRGTFIVLRLMFDEIAY